MKMKTRQKGFGIIDLSAALLLAAAFVWMGVDMGRKADKSQQAQEQRWDAVENGAKTEAQVAVVEYLREKCALPVSYKHVEKQAKDEAHCAKVQINELIAQSYVAQGKIEELHGVKTLVEKLIPSH